MDIKLQNRINASLHQPGKGAAGCNTMEESLLNSLPIKAIEDSNTVLSVQAENTFCSSMTTSPLQQHEYTSILQPQEPERGKK